MKVKFNFVKMANAQALQSKSVKQEEAKTLSTTRQLATR